MAPLDVRIIGAGVIPFTKPSNGTDYPQLGAAAAALALADAGVSAADCDAGVASYCYGEPTSGHRVMNDVGLLGVPVYSVNSNCSSGSSAICLGAQLLRSGAHRCVLVVGFDKMEKGGLSHHYLDRSHPQDPHFEAMRGIDPDSASPPATRPDGAPAFKNAWTENCTRVFCSAARELMAGGAGPTTADFEAVARKNRRHGALNQNALLQRALGDRVDRRLVCSPLTAWMCAPMADGAAAVVMCAAGVHADRPAVLLRGVALVSDTVQSRKATTSKELVGSVAAERAAKAALAQAQTTINEVDLVELHDCYASAEPMLYESLGLCDKGGAAKAVASFQWERTEAGGEVCWMSISGGGRCVVNPSGGLLSKGHPIGATGVAQCVEIVTQLRGSGGKRQVPGATTALQHNFGMGGGAVVAVYQREHSGKPRL